MLSVPNDPQYFLDFFKNSPTSDSFQDIFENTNKLELEIGCGHGHFLVELAGRNGAINFIGIEKSLKRALKTYEKIKKHSIENLKIIFADARGLLSKINKKNEISRVYINFPDPWFKRRHGKRRLIEKNFLDTVVQKIEKEGNLYIVSDYLRNITDATKFLKSNFSVKLVSENDYLDEKNNYPKTLYNQKFEQMDKSIHFLKYLIN